MIFLKFTHKSVSVYKYLTNPIVPAEFSEYEFSGRLIDVKLVEGVQGSVQARVASIDVVEASRLNYYRRARVVLHQI